MIKHLIYGVFGLLAACVIALAIYLDKPAPETVAETPIGENEELVDAQIAGASAAIGDGEAYEVVKVIDGDTISVSKGGSSEVVRFIGINAPETGQCFSNESTQKLKNVIGSDPVSLELDASQGERDKYDRLLAYVITQSGLNTAKVLIEGGFAKEYTYSKPYKYQTEFKEAQMSAQTGQKGLWAPGACSTPAPAPTPVVKKEPLKEQKVVEAEPQEEPEEPEEEKEEEKSPPKSNGNYVCSTNTYNCGDFSTHAEAQAVFDACGGASNDVHKLDANKDGEACESLP